MSRSSNETLNCPQCGENQTLTVWSSINVDLDPQLREQLFSGEINQFNCSACQHSAFINTHLLYHDMKRQFAVQYHPPQSLDEPEFIATFEPTHPPRMKGLPKNVGYIGEPHLTFDMNGFLACILFHERIRDQSDTGEDAAQN